MYKKYTLLLLLLSTFLGVFAEKYTLSGYIKDASNGEELIGATIYIKERQTGNITNVYGFYSLTVDEGIYTIEYSYIGYQTQSVTVNLTQNVRKNIELSLDSKEIQEVIVGAEALDKNIKSVEMSSTKLEIKQVKSIPVLLGEQDVIKTIQLLPGVKSAGEGSGGYYVRGGGTDQNLILLDEAPVYSASHLGGLFSVFNSDAIKDAKLIKGGMPAEYGGRLSSVMDVKMKDGNSKKHTFSGGIGLISSRLTVEGPLLKDKASYIISGRRTYADVFLKLSKNEDLKDTKLYFYDLNTKINFVLNENNKIYLSGYFGRDVLKYQDLMEMDWGNTTTTIRWNHLFTEKLFKNTSLIFSDYMYHMAFYMVGDMSLRSGIRDYNIKTDFQYFLNTNNTLKFGFNGIKHTFYPGEIDVTYEMEDENGLMSEQDTTISVPTTHALEGGLYIQNEQKISEKLSLNYGVRISSFTNIGPRAVYENFEQDKVVNARPLDTVRYESNDHINTYIDYEPRLLVNYVLNDVSSIKGSVTKTTQYINLLQVSSSGTPVDYWIPCTEVVKPQVAYQYAVGYFRNFKNHQYETSVEIYYKDLMNQFTFRNGAEVMLNDKIEHDLVFGKGRSYGAEFLIKKAYGDLTGWVSYTISKTENYFEAKSDEWYSTKYDRTHDVSVVGVYKFSDKFNVSSSWVYYTGDAITLPSGKYPIDGKWVNYYEKPNIYRAPDYHRLDIGCTYTQKLKKNRESSWNFSIYNVYSRKNPYMILTATDENNPNETYLNKISLYPILPSVTWNFKF